MRHTVHNAFRSPAALCLHRQQVLHDARLHGLYREMARLRPDLAPGGFHETLHRMYPGRYPHDVGASGGFDLPQLQQYGVAMVGDLAGTATTMFVHSTHAADLIELDCGRRPDVAFPLPVPPSAHRGDGDPNLVGSFGIVAPSKAGRSPASRRPFWPRATSTCSCPACCR